MNKKLDTLPKSIGKLHSLKKIRIRLITKRYLLVNNTT